MAAGSNTPTTVASFNGANGRNPEAGLIFDSAGNLYGTKPSGPYSAPGSIFEIANGSNAITPLAAFTSQVVNNGSNPDCDLAMDAAENLYGTTAAGGANNDGTVFELLNGSQTITTLVNFNVTAGAGPYAGVILDASGNRYGTTQGGGASSTKGTVFEIAKGSGTVTTLVSFDGADGANPDAGVTMDASGHLYGTTSRGGAADVGTVFKL